MQLLLSVWCGANRFEHCEVVFDSWYKWFFRGLKIDGATLDMDSTIMTRYGLKQQGATKGYNPKKSGRNSHYPLMAFVADTHMVGNIWLSPGNSGTANNAVGFFGEYVTSPVW